MASEYRKHKNYTYATAYDTVSSYDDKNTAHTERAGVYTCMCANYVYIAQHFTISNQSITSPDNEDTRNAPRLLDYAHHDERVYS